MSGCEIGSIIPASLKRTLLPYSGASKQGAMKAFPLAIFFLLLRVVSISLAENSSAFKPARLADCYPHKKKREKFMCPPFGNLLCDMILSVGVEIRKVVK